MDAEKMIARQRALVADLGAKFTDAKAVLRGMEMLARVLPDSQRADALPGTAAEPPAVRQEARELRSSGGRQPGSISKSWRKVLGSLLIFEDEWFTEKAVAETVATLEGRTIRPAEVRRIFEKYQKHGFIEKNSAGRYRVTETAAEKFGLGATTPKPRNENEAPNGEAAGASDVQSGGASPPPPSVWANLSHPTGSTS